MTIRQPDLEALFQPFACKSLRLRNRTVMAPMTRMFAPDGVLAGEVDAYYARRAAGGTGLIVSEGTVIGHPVSHFSSTVPHFYGDAALERWRSVVAAIHAAGGAFVPQLWHTGSSRRRNLVSNPDVPSVSASDLSEAELSASAGSNAAPPHDHAHLKPEPMTDADIEAVIAAFADAARAAKAIGCDGVAIHGAHGYLIDQFLWARSNLREDRYGGDIGNRVRFGAELIAAVRAAVGPDFAIMFRFSQWKSHDYGARLAETPAELERILGPLAEAGVDIFDASTRRFWQPEFEGSPLNLAGWAKALTGKAAMTVGSVGLESPFTPGGRTPGSAIATDNVAVAAAMVERGEVDLIGVGRALIANPDWADRVREGAFDRLRPYDARGHRRTLEQIDAE
ncbi:12-oxophytodienoate reductase [Sphingomonas sp. CGMCC 1.13654]|uniref:12-oxophytodienoate reductase n=2 Tax=Sphingomonas chungangi TaxID=2683589 RepID=A0A838L6H8_9SPHN|nr:12-oxophytodienoate reductase [Sphingomonas chungangi]